MIKENKKFLLVEQEFDSCFKNLESKAKLCSLGKIENMQLSFREARKNLNFIQCQQRILIKETITIPDFKYCQFLAKYFSVNLFGFKNLDCFQNLCYFVLLILIIIIFLFLGFTIGENYLCQGFCYYFIVTFIGISLWPLSFLLGTLVMSPLLWLIEKQKQVTIKSHHLIKLKEFKKLFLNLENFKFSPTVLIKINDKIYEERKEIVIKLNIELKDD